MAEALARTSVRVGALAVVARQEPVGRVDVLAPAELRALAAAAVVAVAMPECQTAPALSRMFPSVVRMAQAWVAQAVHQALAAVAAVGRSERSIFAPG